jgi:hypothetical protein
MAGPQTKAGLCKTCAHRDNCSLTGCNGIGIFECAEHEPAGVTPAPSGNGAPVEEQVASAAPVLGLCMDCAGREGCTFSRPEGGVWHCEEYATE